ncbi:MAG: PTS sugar transporter subunit IIC, partial [Selenomonas sp.]|nr:PTS sugar transporter subunit IIC [Selenomonas sp.]
PYLLVPFVIVPLIAMFITYFAITTGFMAPFSAVQVPWTTPPVIAGFLLNGWQGAVVQIVNLAIATVIYFPFLKAQDNAFLKEERGETAESEEQAENAVMAEVK